MVFICNLCVLSGFFFRNCIFNKKGRSYLFCDMNYSYHNLIHFEFKHVTENVYDKL